MLFGLTAEEVTEYSMMILVPFAILGLYAALYDVTRREPLYGKIVLWFVLALGTVGFIIKTVLIDFGVAEQMLAK